MISDELLKQVQELNRVDKLWLIQMLANDLAQEENPALIEGVSYEIWSPYDSGDAAKTLLQMLEDDNV
jgi:hypothetical protein